MDKTTPTLDLAREYVARGWRPFPVEYGGKRPAVGMKWGTATATTPTDAILRLWFGREPVNVGIAAKGSGLVILDEDEIGGMERLCEDYGHRVPETYRVSTAKGWHWYFRAPADVRISNRPGILADYRFDVRGGAGADGQGDGGYVVAAGSIHESGHIYEAEDPDADTIELPDWLIELLWAEPEQPASNTADAPEPIPDRPFTEEQAGAYVRDKALNRLRASIEPGRNNALNAAAVMFGHFVPGFWNEDEVTEALASVAEEIGLDRREIGPTIRSGLRKGMSEPYTKVDQSAPFGDAPAPSGDAGASASADPFETAVGAELNRLRIADEARRRLARERRADRPRIADGLIDDLDNIPEPVMLLGSLVPESSVGFLAGRSGAYKSFMAVSIACCIATGRSWLGRTEFAVGRPLKTLYVAAEGAKGAAGRIRAWEMSNGISRKGKLLLYAKPIHLNDEAQAEELAEVIKSEGIEFLVIDTYHRSAPGTEENSATDFGVVFEAVARLRDELGCSVLFVDHTGASKTGNPRGTSAKRDDADYVISMSYQGEEATRDSQRELFTTKLKDTDTVGRWPVCLTEVDDSTFPVLGIGTIESGPLAGADTSDWWRLEECPEMPEDAMAALKREADKKQGRGADAARWVWRYLAWIDEEQGVTRAQITRSLAAIPRDKPFTAWAVEKAVPLLDKAGLVDRDKSRVWLTGADS